MTVTPTHTTPDPDERFTARFPDPDPDLDRWGLPEHTSAQLLNIGLDNLGSPTVAEANHLIASNLGMIAGRTSGQRTIEDIEIHQEQMDLDIDSAEFPHDPENGLRADQIGHDITFADRKAARDIDEVTAVLRHLHEAGPGDQFSRLELDPKTLDDYTLMGYRDLLEEHDYNLPVDATGEQIPITFADTLVKHTSDTEATKKLIEDMGLVQVPDAPQQESELDRMVAEINAKNNPSPSVTLGRDVNGPSV